jgi:hypothetical protein
LAGVFRLGANATSAELDWYLRGQAEPTAFEHDVIALALNERLHELGFDRPMPYHDEP